MESSVSPRVYQPTGLWDGFQLPSSIREQQGWYSGVGNFRALHSSDLTDFEVERPFLVENIDLGVPNES